MPTLLNQDYFYVCRSHLKDKGFATPVVDEKAEAEKRKKEAMDIEIQKIKQEYEGRQKSKKSKKKAKDDKDKKSEDDDSKAEKERDDKVSLDSSTRCIGSLMVFTVDQSRPGRHEHRHSRR